MPVKTWVGRFAIVQGQPQEEGPHLHSFPRQRPDEEEDELYVLVEPASAGSEEYTGQLVDAIGRMYQQDPLSLTGALLRSLKAAHQQLLQWNQRSLPEHRIGAGVSCLAVRGRTAYLAQVGPAVAYHVGDGRFRRIEPEDGAAEPLGQPEQVQPDLSSYQLSPGDLLLLASPRIHELLDEEALRSILLQGANQALPELFRLARDQQEFSLVLLACVVEPETETATAVAVAPSAEPQEAAPPPLEPEAERDAIQRAPAAALEEPPASAEAAIEETAAVAEPPEGFSQPRVRLRGDEANIRYPATTGLRANLPRVPAQAIAAVLVLAVIGLLAFCVIPPTLEESRGDRYDSLVEDARVRLGTAGSAADPDLRRESLRAADEALLEAEGLRPGDPRVAQLRSEVDAKLTELDAVLELPDLELIADLSERVPGPVSFRELALGGGAAYFLDGEQGRVVAISLLAPNPEPVIMFRAGDPVGTQIAGQPQHIAWAQELGALLILDDARRLVAARFGEAPRLLAVREAGAWSSADGIAYAGGNLYVLDREADQVWRYLPTQSGFDSEREALLRVAGGDLDQALELAVSDAVYLVRADGAIQRFAETAQLLPLSGIDQPLNSPASVVPLPASRRVLVADRGNKRIVVFSPEGTFRQQFKSSAFNDLRAIAVDEPNNLLYILVGGALYRTALPPPPPAS